MNLAERYARLHDGIGFALETIDTTYHLPKALRQEIHGRVLADWERFRSGIGWCDNDMDVLNLTTGLTRLADEYSRLRKTLFSDLHHFGPEPPWRRVHHGLAVRLPLQVNVDASEYYVLSDQGMNRWTFSVHGLTRSTQDAYEPTLTEFGVELAKRSCLIPEELKGHRLLNQLFYSLELMKDEHYYMRTLQDQAVLEAERIVHAETEDDGWE